MKVWRLHIMSVRGYAVVDAPYRPGELFRYEDIPAKLIGVGLSITATGPHEVPTPAW